MLTIRVFQNDGGKEPFTEWLDSLPPKTRFRVFDRLYRVEQGNFGDFKHVGNRVYELRFFFDGGLRVYFGREGNEIVILLCGGDKSGQKRDIEKAQEYWRQYRERKEE